VAAVRCNNSFNTDCCCLRCRRDSIFEKLLRDSKTQQTKTVYIDFGNRLTEMIQNGEAHMETSSNGNKNFVMQSQTQGSISKSQSKTPSGLVGRSKLRGAVNKAKLANRATKDNKNLRPKAKERVVEGPPAMSDAGAAESLGGGSQGHPTDDIEEQG